MAGLFRSSDFWRKLIRLVLLNVIYFIILAPLLTAVYFFMYGFIFARLQQAGSNLSDLTVPMLPGMLLAASQALPAAVRYILLAASIVMYGPANCGMAYMLRSIVRREDAGISDFFIRLRQNFKQGLALGLLDIFLIGLLVFNICALAGVSSDALAAVRYMSMALLFFYLLMRHYLCLMAVTARLKINQLLKNALIFAGLGFWRNILTIFINTALIFATMSIFSAVEFLAVPLLMFSVTGFVAVFICFPVVKKYMLDPQITEQVTEQITETEDKI